VAGKRVSLREQRRSEVVLDGIAVLELGLQFRDELRVRVQPRDLVFVLVGMTPFSIDGASSNPGAVHDLRKSQ
jgi:hypothetical protein